MTISKNWFSYLTRAFTLSLCTAFLLNFVSCSDSSTSQDPKVKIILDANGGSFPETNETKQTFLIKKNQTSKLSTADELGLSRENHNFTGWAKSQQGTVEYNDGADITFSTDLTLYAQWEAVNSTYTVKHLLQNIADDEYTEDSTEQKSGKSGTQTAAAAKTYEGFTAKTFAQETIQADGTTVVEIYYTRNTYTISYSSKYGNKPQAKTVKYEYVLTTSDLPDLTQANYSFNGWILDDGDSITAGYTVKKDITLTALWDEIIATYTVKHLLQNLQDDSYTEKATEQKLGKSGTQTVAAAKTYEGFTAKTFEQKTIQADGSTVVEIKYDRKTYTISYSSTYGEPPASKTVRYGYQLTAADLPVLLDTVLSFNGWLFDGASIEAGYKVKTNITLTAQWDIVIATYTVKHLLQNLQDDSYTEKATEQKLGKSGTQTVAAAKTYEGFTAKTFAQATILDDGSTVVDIYYDRNTYTVSYSSTYGEPPASKTVKYGYVLTAADLPDLTQTNYSFKGWLIDGASIAAGYTVKKAITLTALWDEIIAIYTVKHLLQNLQDDSYTEEAAEPKSGKSGTQTVAAAKSYEGFTAKTFEQKTIQADGSTVVEIKYDRKTYTISYSSEYGDAPTSKTVKYEYILTAADLPHLTQTNYSFNGWLLDGASIEAGYTVKKDITLTAQWDEIIASYTVKHFLQNLKDDSYTEKAAEPKSGKSGTKTSAAAKSYEGFTAKTFAQATIQADGSTVVEIYYDRNTYTVSYSSTYGEPPASKTVKYGYELTAEDLPMLTQNYYSFKSWILDGVSIVAGYTVKGTVTLTAQWEGAPSTYTVKHLLQNLKDDSYTEEAAEQKSGTYGTQTAAAAKTYEGFTAKSFTQATIQANGSTVVEIHYDRNTYTISYSSTYGEPPASKTVKYGYILTAADLPVLPDTVLSFNGWRLGGASVEAGYTVKTVITLTAKWKAPTSVTKETISEVIAALTEDSTIVLTGELTDSDLTEIATAIKNSSYKVNLDLSQTTGLTSIPAYIFRDCSKLSGITFPNSVTSIGNYAFYNCTSLSSVTIPDSVTTIKVCAFNSCSSLSSVTIPDSVTTIGPSAFLYCTSLTTITVDSNNPQYSSIDGVLFIKDATAIITYPAGKQSAAYTIPDSVTTIAFNAFAGCTFLSSVTIPDSVTSIETYAFNVCTSLTTITVDSNNPNYSSIDGVLFNKDATAIIIYPAGKQSAAYTIPNSVTSIGDYAFSYCTSLSSVTIGNSVTSIGRSAFKRCSKLSSVTFRNTAYWYRTNSSSDWNNKTNGTLTNLTAPATNVTYFTNTYEEYYWYKRYW